MSASHPVHYLVKALRNNAVVQIQEVANHETALELKERFELVPHTSAEIVEVHERAETDLTTHTREIIEDLKR